jgi:hypothetical protein
MQRNNPPLQRRATLSRGAFNLTAMPFSSTSFPSHYLYFRRRSVLCISQSQSSLFIHIVSPTWKREFIGRLRQQYSSFRLWKLGSTTAVASVGVRFQRRQWSSRPNMSIVGVPPSESGAWTSSAPPASRGVLIAARRIPGQATHTAPAHLAGPVSSYRYPALFSHIHFHFSF